MADAPASQPRADPKRLAMQRLGHLSKKISKNAQVVTGCADMGFDAVFD